MKSWFIRHIHLAGRSAAIISTSHSTVHSWHMACSRSDGSSWSSPQGMSRVADHCRATASSYSSITLSDQTSVLSFRM